MVEQGEELGLITGCKALKHEGGMEDLDRGALGEVDAFGEEDCSGRAFADGVEQAEGTDGRRGHVVE